MFGWIAFAGPLILLVVGVCILARRDEHDLARMWRRLLSPSARPFRDSVRERVDAQEELLAATRGWARAARKNGDLEHARRMEAQGRALSAKLQHHELLLVRRMLSALRGR